MAVKIRLKRIGKIRTPFYRIVVADSRKKRDGRVIEEIGTYNPKTEPSTIHVVSERAQYWLGVGAQPTEAVARLLTLSGDIGGENTLKEPAAKADKAALFDEALKALHSDSSGDATTKKAAKKAPAQKTAPKAAAAADAQTEPADAPEAAAETAEAADAAETEPREA